MRKPEPDFTMDELFLKLQEELGTGEDGTTTSELCKKLNRSRGWVLDRLHRLDDDGLLEKVTKKVPAYGKRGGLTIVAYRLKGKEGVSLDGG